MSIQNRFYYKSPSFALAEGGLFIFTTNSIYIDSVLLELLNILSMRVLFTVLLFCFSSPILLACSCNCVFNEMTLCRFLHEGADNFVEANLIQKRQYTRFIIQISKKHAIPEFFVVKRRKISAGLAYQNINDIRLKFIEIPDISLHFVPKNLDGGDLR